MIQALMYAEGASHIGARLQIARNWIGKERSEIARLMGIAPATYSHFELGKRPLPHERLKQAADALCVPLGFLTRASREFLPAQNLSYRKRVSLKSSDAKHVQSVASMASEFMQLIDSFVTLPSVTVPSLTPKTSIDIENIVRDIRSSLNMSDAPLRHTLDLVESMGILVFWVSADRMFDGVSFWDSARPYILLNGNQKDAYRARFTLLHELGHLVLHRQSGDTSQLEDERRRLDREADDFASAFLLPASSFAKRFPRYGSLNDILDERRYWMSSCAAMVRRARQLRMITEDHYRRLCVSLSARGWRLGEPNTPLAEHSRVHRFFLDEAGEKGFTTYKLAEMIECPVNWIREAFPQSEQYQMEFNMDAFK